MKKLKKIQLIAILTGVITFILVYFFLQDYQAENQGKKVKREYIVTAAADIEPLAQITKEMIKVTEVPSEAIHPDTVRSTEEALGKICDTKIYAGEPILAAKISDAGDPRSGLAWEIETGKRAITLETGIEAGVANMIRPGNRVDLITAYEVEGPEDVIARYEYLIQTYPEYFRLKMGKGGTQPGGKGENQTSDLEGMNDKTGVSTMLLQDVKVLAIDSISSTDTYASVQPAVYASVTLEVTPQQAVLIDAMSGSTDRGHIRMVLRRQDDEEIPEIERVKTKFNYNFDSFFEEGKSEERDKN